MFVETLPKIGLEPMRFYNVNPSVPAVAKYKTSPPSGFVPKQSDGFDEWKEHNVRRSLHPLQKSLAHEGHATLYRHVAIRRHITVDSEWSSQETATTATADKTLYTPPPTQESSNQNIRRIRDEDILDTLPALRALDEFLKRATGLNRARDEDVSDASSLTALSDLGTKESSDATLVSDDYLVDWDNILPSTGFQDALFTRFGAVEELRRSSKPSAGVPLEKAVPFRELANCPTDQLNDKDMSRKQFPTKSWVKETSSKVNANYAEVRANLRKVGGDKKSATTAPETSDFASQEAVLTHPLTDHQLGHAPRKLVPEREGHDFYTLETKNNPTLNMKFDGALTTTRQLNQALQSGQNVFGSSAACSTPDTSNLSSRWTNVVSNSFPTDDSRKTLLPFPSPPNATAFEEKDHGQVSIHRGPEFTKLFATLHAGIRQQSADNRIQVDGQNSEVPNAISPAPSLKKNAQNDLQYEKYFRMIKTGLPMGADKNSMMMDGCDSSILDGDSNAALPIETLKSDTIRRFRVHWEENLHAGSNTVWAMAKDDPDANIHMDLEEVERLLRSELASNAPSTTSRHHEQTVVKVIDIKRANNGGIALARIRIPYGEIARAIDNL